MKVIIPRLVEEEIDEKNKRQKEEEIEKEKKRKRKRKRKIKMWVLKEYKCRSGATEANIGYTFIHHDILAVYKEKVKRHIHMYINIYQSIGIVVSVCQWHGVQSQVKSYQRFKKMYLMPPSITPKIIRCGPRGSGAIKGKE